MILKEKKRNPRSMAMILDMLHIVVGILVVICVVLAFLDPVKNRILFPAVFWLASFLNGVNGWFRFRAAGHDRRGRTAGLAYGVLAVFLLTVGIISAVSIWR